MSKDPAFLFYYQDFLVGTTFMTLEERGAYITLLCYQADKGKISEDEIIKIISRPIWEAICCKFIFENGYFFNKRLSKEIEKRKAFTESRRKNLHMDNHMDTHKGVHMGEAMESHMENENENINININKEKDRGLGKGKKKEEYSPDFLSFWNSYPNKSGSKKAAFDIWVKMKNELPDIEIILSAIIIQKGWRKNSNGEFRPEWKAPERWLKNKMWEAEVGGPTGIPVEEKKDGQEPEDDFLNCSGCGTRMYKDDLNNGLCKPCEGKK